MTDLSALKPGDYLVTPTYGNAFDRFVGSSIRYVTATRDQYGKFEDARVNHAAIYVGDGKIVEAAPGGARLVDWDTYGDSAIWSVNGVAPLLRDGSNGPRIDISDAARDTIAAKAKSLIGTRYGYLDLAAIGLAQKRLHSLVHANAPLSGQEWWVRKVESMHTLICSQLVDVSLQAGGVQLFQDGRLPGLVSPADLYARML